MAPVFARRAVVALGLAVAVAACGGGDPLPASGPDGPEPPRATPGPTATPTPTPTPTPAPTPTPTPTPVPTPEPTPSVQPFAGVPIFPGSRPVRLDLEGGEWEATYASDAPLVEVRDFYDRALADAGWRIEARDARRDGVVYRIERGDEEGRVRLRGRADGTEIQITVERN